MGLPGRVWGHGVRGSVWVFAGGLGRAVLGYKLLMIQPGKYEGTTGLGGGVVSLLAFQRANMPPEDPLATLLVGHLIG